MRLFGSLKVCLFSEVNGVVMSEGKPVAGVEIIQTAKINTILYTYKTITDDFGRFHLEERRVYSVNKIAPVEPYIAQKIKINYLGKEYLAWDIDKRNYDTNGELGRNLKLQCDLSQKESRKEFDARILWGICNLQ